MGKPVIFVVDDEPAVLRTLVRELESRYGIHYQVVHADTPAAALDRLAELRAVGQDVALVLADHWLHENNGSALLARAKDLHPLARRGLLVTWGDRRASASVRDAAALGRMDFYLAKPAGDPDERFHRAVTESLEEWWRRQDSLVEAATVIAADPSARGHEIRDLLTRNSVPFRFLARGSAAGLAVLTRLELAEQQVPVLALFDGTVLLDPTNAEVAEALGLDVRPSERTYDVAIVGGGPAGLAAAVYAASEGLSTVVLEPEAFGGQAGTSSLIRNYLGFPNGVSGVDLALRAYQQAWLFGTHFVYGNSAISLTAEGDLRAVGLSDGSELRSRCVIVATGASYRRLAVPYLESLVGAGVYYGAATVESRSMAGRQVFVVGGGNSAGQAALHLARYAERVTILVRSHSLAASMSNYLIREIENEPKVDVRHGVEVVGGGGEGYLRHLLVRQRASGAVESVAAGGLFILIGAQPYTGWLPDTVARDDWGYILTGHDTGARWARQRLPFLFEASLPGVFAIGDVRHGSVKRVASAVGEGSIAIRLVHEYLDLAEYPASI